MRVARRGRASHPEAIATLTNSRDARSVTAVRDYTATLAAVMQESEDLRVALSSRRPRAGSDTSDDDGDGEATARGDAGTAASASVALADRVRALGHACCALEAGELEGAVEGVGWASQHAGSSQLPQSRCKRHRVVVARLASRRR